MYAQVEKTKEKENRAVANSVSQKSSCEQNSGFAGLPSVSVHQESTSQSIQFKKSKSIFQFDKSKKQRALEKEAKSAKDKERLRDKKEWDDFEFEIARVKTSKEVKKLEQQHIKEARVEFKIDKRKDHIINRHIFGSKHPGKTLFPEAWKEQDILNAITQVCMNSTTYSESAKYGKSIRGWHDSVLIEVYFFIQDDDTEKFEVSTAYPLKGTGVKTNPGTDTENEL